MNKHLLTLIATSLLGGCMASAGVRATSEPPPPPPPQTEVREHRHEPRIIEGRVLDADTRQPIDRAAVDITSPAFQGERTVNTGPDGRFRTEEIPRGEFGFRCRRDGYEPYITKAVMREGIAHMDCELRRKR
jgi:hypothetical protein